MISSHISNLILTRDMLWPQLWTPVLLIVSRFKYHLPRLKLVHPTYAAYDNSAMYNADKTASTH